VLPREQRCKIFWQVGLLKAIESGHPRIVPPPGMPDMYMTIDRWNLRHLVPHRVVPNVVLIPVGFS
jgi:hypothetical protein